MTFTQMPHNRDLTVCSVSYHSKRLLDLNWELTSTLNAQPPKEWLVAENSPEGSEVRLSTESGRFIIHAGVAYDPIAKRPASDHHARAMQALLPHIRTRYAVFLDPDCFIVRKQWINDVLGHMNDKKLGFFGIPYHPRWHMKYRYFPCAQCMFVDLDLVDKNLLDFLPSPRNENFDKTPVALSPCKNSNTSNTAGFVKKCMRRGMLMLHSIIARWRVPTSDEREQIGSSTDMGYRIFETFSNNPFITNECAVPIFWPSTHWKELPHLWSRRNRRAERFLEDSRCFIPKRPNYFSERAYWNRDLLSVYRNDWELFDWRGVPFCFHVRSYPKSLSGKLDEHIDLLISRLANLRIYEHEPVLS